MVVLTLSVPWAVWVTSSCWGANTEVERAKEIRHTVEQIYQEHKEDLNALRKDIRDLDAKIADTPPEVWKQKILTMECDVKRVLLSLELIRAKMGIATTVPTNTTNNNDTPQ